MRTIQDLKTFVPSKDFATSNVFYSCMGFAINWASEDVCELEARGLLTTCVEVGRDFAEFCRKSER